MVIASAPRRRAATQVALAAAVFAAAVATPQAAAPQPPGAARATEAAAEKVRSADDSAGAAERQPAADGRVGLFEPRPVDRETYSETTTLMAILEDGTFIQWELAISNIGPGDDHAACRAFVAKPGLSPWSAEKILDRKEWLYSKDSTRERLELGPCTLVRTLGTRLVAELDGWRLSLDVPLPPTRTFPPDGNVRFGDGDFFELRILVPWSSADAEITRPGVAPQRLSGTAHIDHFRVTARPTALATKLVRFRGLSAVDNSWLLAARVPADGGPAQGWLWRDDMDAPVRLTGLEVATGASAVDSDHKTFSLEATAVGIGHVRIRTEAGLFRVAPVEKLGLIGYLVRPFLGNPVTYRQWATLEVEHPGTAAAPRRGRGILDVTLTND